MKYCKSLLLLSIMIFCLCSYSQTTITEFIQYDVDLLSFKENQNSETQLLNYLERLFKSVKQNKIKVYDAEYNLNKMNFDFKEIDTSKTDSLFLFVNEYIVAIWPDSTDPFSLYDSLIHVIQNISSRNVVKISFIEKWTTDEKGNIIKTVEAFAPVVISESYYKIEIPLFWVKSSDMPDLNFKVDITYRVKIKEKNVYDEFWYANNILPPKRLMFLQPFIEKIEKGELKEFVLDTLLPNRKIDTIHFIKPLEFFISLEIISIEWDPFIVKDGIICELTASGVIAIDFKEKWVLSSTGFTKTVSEYALVSRQYNYET